MLSQENIIEQIQEVLELVRPKFWLHGGNIELVKFVDGIVYVRLSGSCDGCPSSIYTLTLLVESELKREVCQVTKVIEISD